MPVPSTCAAELAVVLIDLLIIFFLAELTYCSIECSHLTPLGPEACHFRVQTPHPPKIPSEYPCKNCGFVLCVVYFYKKYRIYFNTHLCLLRKSIIP